MMAWYIGRFLALAAALALTVGLAWGISAHTAIWLVQEFSYWFLLALSIATGAILISLNKDYDFSFAKIKWPLVLITFGSIFLIHSTETRYQILLDEPSVAATSLGIHLDRKIYKPCRTHTVEGQYVILKGDLDKRPPAMAFLISLLHDLTGYRFENNFWVNRLLTPILLSLIYAIAYELGGLAGGISAIVLACSLPLLGFAINSCGLEILFVTLILGLWYTATRYIKSQSPLLLGLLICLTIWIAQTRYEGLIFVLPTGLTILTSWIINRKVHWPISCSFVPLLFLPSLWHHRIFEVEPLLWELKTKGLELPFSISYFYKNLGHFLHFLFGSSGTQPNSFILSALGIFSLVLMIVKSPSVLKNSARQNPAVATLYIFSGTLIGFALMLLCYFWGQLDDPIVMRLGLILILGLLFPLTYCFWKMKSDNDPLVGFARRFEYGHWVFAIGVTVSFLGWTLPKIARSEWMEINILAKNAQCIQEFARSMPENSLMISPVSILWTPLKVNCIKVDRALNYKEALQAYMDRPDKPIVYLHEWIHHKTNGEIFYSEDMTRLSRIRENPSFEIEPVKAYFPRPYTGVQISRVVRVLSSEEQKNKAQDFVSFYNLP